MIKHESSGIIKIPGSVVGEEKILSEWSLRPIYVTGVEGRMRQPAQRGLDVPVYATVPRVGCADCFH